MAFSVIQAGTDLQLLDTAGNLTTLALPTGVTLRDDVPPRWCVYGRYVVLVDTPSEPLTIDVAGVVRLLSPKAPRIAPVLSGVSGGALTGTFRAKDTFITLDGVGNIISESDFSPASNSVTIATDFLSAANLDISPDQVSGRRLYRTTDNGAVYFQWLDLDGNVLTVIQDDLSDAGLSIFAAPILGTPPRLTLIGEFRGRLFGVGDVDIDHVRYTEAGIQYAWPADNVIEIPAIGSDEFGIRALIPRREALGCGRRNSLVQITGTGAENAITGDIDFDAVILSKELGVESQESVVVFRDTAFFLWKDGVYRWNTSGLMCVSDGLSASSTTISSKPSGYGNVRSWFTTDDYFNRDSFQYAFAVMDVDRAVYRLFLASAGSLVIDRWIEYDIDNGTWWGPHKTDLFFPTSAFSLVDASNKQTPLIGAADTNIYRQQSTRTDDSGVSQVAIALDAVGKRHGLGLPDQDKYFGQLSMLGRAQTKGRLGVAVHIGSLEGMTGPTFAYNMTLSRERLGRLGTGKHAQLELTNADLGMDVEIFGYIVDPAHLLGRR